jgi:hypothetical protein
MQGGQGIETSGQLPEPGTYALRAACTDGPGAILAVRQNGAVLVSERIDCGSPFDAVLELDAGQVSAALEPFGDGGLIGGAVRFAGPVPQAETGSAS